MKQKCKEWLGSAAGRISLLLFIISLLMLFIACSSWEATSERAASNINNILFGISTNLLGIIVTVSFVQYFIDMQDEKQAQLEEVALIKRYDRLTLPPPLGHAKRKVFSLFHSFACFYWLFLQQRAF